jgi:hypothetical protein
MIEYITLFLSGLVFPVIVQLIRTGKTKHDETNKLLNEHNLLQKSVIDSIADIVERQKKISSVISSQHEEHTRMMQSLAVQNEKITHIAVSVSDIHRRMD